MDKPRIQANRSRGTSWELIESASNSGEEDLIQDFEMYWSGLNRLPVETLTQARHSSLKQYVKTRFSTQRAAIDGARRKAGLRPRELVTFEEIASATSGEERTVLKALKARIRKAGRDRCILWVTSLDRIFKNKADFDDLIGFFISYRVRLRSIAEGFQTNGRYTSAEIRMMWLLATREPVVVQQRLVEGRKQMAAQGRPASGPPPYGYKKR